MQADPCLSLGCLTLPTNHLLHSQRRTARPDGLLLMSHWGPEQGHDPVALDLVDGAFVTMDCVDHGPQRRFETLHRLLWIKSLDQLCRALDVSEQDRHLLALAL